ncbi:MAG TPA: RHS repeat-associated core domain-containing protein, partial [Tahibacter sp.]|nr:RHS repeat-associated core domain-containing protein [Tahibacter sp.]
FEYDAIDDSIKSITRADSKFERAGNDVFVFDRVFFIARQAGGWRWYDRKGNWIRYTNEGRIVAYGDRNDVAVHFTRGGPRDQITAVTDHRHAPVLTFRYEGDRLASITDRADRKVQYRYNGGELAEVVDVGSNSWSYGYTNGLMTSRTDPEGRATTIGYSGNRVVSVTDPLQYKTNYEYAFDKGKRQYTIVTRSPEGRRVEKRYDADGLLLSETHGTRQVYTLKRAGEYTHIHADERGLQTRVEFDTSFNPVKVTYPDGTTTAAKYDVALGLPLEHVDERGTKTVFGYDAKGNLKTLTEAQGTPVERVTTMTYDDVGQMRTRTVTGVGATVERTYDGYGNVETATDAERHTAQMTYDVAGNVLTRRDARGKTWSATYAPQGWMTTTTDPLGYTITYRHDKTGNLRERIDQENRSSTYDYFADGQLERVTDATGAAVTFGYDKDRRPVSTTDANGVAMLYGYDADGRHTASTDADGNVVAVDYGRDAMLAGRVERVRYPTYCEEYKYDQRGRTTQIATVFACDDAASRIERQAFGYDAAGNLVSRTDALGRTTLFGYDALGRLQSQTDALSGATRFEYDALDNPTRVTDASGNARRYGYDKNGLLTSEARSLGATVEYRYDATANVIGRTSAGGERRLFDYDDAGRPLSERYFDAGSNEAGQAVSYTYDKRGWLTGYVQTGDTRSSAVYEHDGAGRRTRETVTYGAGAAAFTRVVDEAYYPNGKRKKITYPGDVEIEFGYTPAGRLERAGVPGGGDIHWSDYDWRVARKVSLSGAVRSYTYDPLQRIAGIKVQALGGGTPQAPAGAVVMDYGYTYDAAGNVTQKATQHGEFTYAYDALDRLKEAVPPAALIGPAPDGLPQERYGYDATHNRRSSETNPGEWRYDADGQLLGYGLGAQRRRFEHDPNGNLAASFDGDGQTAAETFVYDATERLRELRRGGQVVARYQYDPFGRRIRKETAAGVVWYQYNQQGLIAEYTAAGEPATIYGWRPGAPWGTAPLWSATRAGGSWNANFYHNDLLEAPQFMTGADGAVVWAGVSQAFGETRVSPSSSVSNPLRLPGQYFDAESGTHYNLFRDYEPQLGRYRQSDPIGQRGGINTYAYVRGNPQARIDPWGLVDLNYASPLPTPGHTSPAAYWRAWDTHAGLALIQSPKGALTVGIHSNGEVFIAPDHSSWTAEHLADRIRKDMPDYKKYDSIYLYACRTGAIVKEGVDPLAQQVASLLDIKVYGLSQYGWISSRHPLEPFRGSYGKKPDKTIDRVAAGDWAGYFPEPLPIRTNDDERFIVRP